jgi:hypothetical protein
MYRACRLIAPEGAMTNEAYPDALPVGYRLHWYLLEHVLGQGGFSTTYLARDTSGQSFTLNLAFAPAPPGQFPPSGVM